MDMIDRIVFGGLIVILLMVTMTLVLEVRSDNTAPDIHTALTCEQVQGVVVCVER